jgi:hypothetical protein
VGYLFRPIGVVKRGLFFIAAVALLIPVVHAGEHVELTWAINGAGLFVAVCLLAVEWVARSTRSINRPAALGSRS